MNTNTAPTDVANLFVQCHRQKLASKQSDFYQQYTNHLSSVV